MRMLRAPKKSGDGTPGLRETQAEGTAVALGLGSNRGDRRHALRRAVRGLVPWLHELRVASLYLTAAEGAIAAPDYLNTAIVGRTALAPEELLGLAKALEWQAGRRLGPRNAPRTLDVDLLLYGDLTRARVELTLPHPRLAERRFALAPLAELCPGWKVPPGDRTVRELLTHLPPGSGVVRVGELFGPGAL